MDKHWHDGTIYGEPILETKKYLEKLSNKFNLIIYTCKANPNRPLINNKTGIELIWGWLKKNKLHTYISEVTFGKPNAIAYIDDKAIRFTGWKKCYEQLNTENLL